MKSEFLSVFGKLAPLARGLLAFLAKLFSPFRRLFSLLHRGIHKLWLLPPCRRIDSFWQRTWRRRGPLQYYFLPYVTSVLRVVAWAVLVIGVVGSIALGLQVLTDGLIVQKTELVGIRSGIAVILLGIVSSFLVWLSLLAVRDLFYLFIHVKENTGTAAQTIARNWD